MTTTYTLVAPTDFNNINTVIETLRSLYDIALAKYNELTAPDAPKIGKGELYLQTYRAITNDPRSKDLYHETIQHVTHMITDFHTSFLNEIALANSIFIGLENDITNEVMTFYGKIIADKNFKSVNYSDTIVLVHSDNNWTLEVRELEEEEEITDV